MFLSPSRQSFSPYSKQSGIKGKNGQSYVSFSSNKFNEINSLKNILQKKHENFSVFVDFYKKECNEICEITFSKLAEVFSSEKLSTDYLKQAIIEIKKEKDIKKAEKIIQKALKQFNKKNAEPIDKNHTKKLIDEGNTVTEKGIDFVLKKIYVMLEYYKKNIALNEIPDKLKYQDEAKVLISEFRKQLKTKKEEITPLNKKGFEIIRKYDDLSNDYKNKIKNINENNKTLLNEITKIMAEKTILSRNLMGGSKKSF